MRYAALACLLLLNCARVGFDGRFGPGDEGARPGDRDLASGDATRVGDGGDPTSDGAGAGDPTAGDPDPADPGPGDPQLSGDAVGGDPASGDPEGDPAGDPEGDPAGDPEGDPAGDPEGGDSQAWVGPPDTPTGIVLGFCSFLCCNGENVGLSWDATPGATHYEVRWTCSGAPETSGNLTGTDYPDAIDYPIGIGWSCGFITADYEVCACNLDGCTCTLIPPPVPNTCGGGCCAWP